MLRILPIRLLLATPLAPYLGRISHPQLEMQLREQSFEPAGVPAGFHAHAHFHSLGRELTIEPLGCLTMLQSALARSPVSVSTNAIC
ncbi:MAG: hypothetical protein WCF26_21060 [Candidatus Sulfotelmatobacter sp.]